MLRGRLSHKLCGLHAACCGCGGVFIQPGKQPLARQRTSFWHVRGVAMEIRGKPSVVVSNHTCSSHVSGAEAGDTRYLIGHLWALVRDWNLVVTWGASNALPPTPS
jgi:hypothetical protein